MKAMMFTRKGWIPEAELTPLRPLPRQHSKGPTVCDANSLDWGSRFQSPCAGPAVRLLHLCKLAGVVVATLSVALALKSTCIPCLTGEAQHASFDRLLVCAHPQTFHKSKQNFTLAFASKVSCRTAGAVFHADTALATSPTSYSQVLSSLQRETLLAKEKP
jgi:hypothetical protein